MTLNYCHDRVSCCSVQLVEAGTGMVITRVGRTRSGFLTWASTGCTGLHTHKDLQFPSLHYTPFLHQAASARLGELSKTHLALFRNNRKSDPQASFGYLRCPGTKIVTGAVIRMFAPALRWEGRQCRPRLLGLVSPDSRITGHRKPALH